MCFRTGQTLRREENKAMKSFGGSFRNLNFSPSTSILLNFFFPFIDIRCFFFLPSIKLHYSRTIVKYLLFKSDDGHAISRQEKRRLPKSTARFPAKKRWHSLPPSGCLGTPLPLPQSLCGRTDVRMYGCTDVRTDGHVTITSRPKFLGLIGYQISLAMELRWRALPAGFAINKLKTLEIERVMKQTNFCYFSQKAT